MIPQPVYDTIKHASYENHGAHLSRNFKTGKKVFALYRNDSDLVSAHIYIHVATDAELGPYKAKGYGVYPNSTHSGPFAAKPISLGQVPDSEATEWEVWDEY